MLLIGHETQGFAHVRMFVGRLLVSLRVHFYIAFRVSNTILREIAQEVTISQTANKYSNRIMYYLRVISQRLVIYDELFWFDFNTNNLHDMW